MKLLSLVAFAGAVKGALASRVSTSSPDFDHLRQSVVRIQAVASTFDWMHPFFPGQDGVGIGSGFVVQAEPYPLFVTNKHVVSDATRVSLQLLLFGEQQWEAQVVSVCAKFDLALLVLKDPEAFAKALATQKLHLEKLEVSDAVAAMGADVVALGFPLGQDSLKISKGNVAGNEDVNGNICIQSTAPISPGNSGGPLLNADGSQVVGVNFAKATSGENINYVIPAFRVKQMITKHLKDQPKMPKDGKWERVNVRVPKHDLTTIESNAALYALSDGCDRGLYVAKVGERSFFNNAKPAVPHGSFLVSVNGNELDVFGMGLNNKYVADRVSFMDLFFMVPDLTADVEFQTCSKGKVTKHTISMAWMPEYDRGVSYVDEPTLAGMSSKYEMFGDISVMEMTVNHISSIISSTGDPGPARWLHPDFVAKPHLIVNFVKSGSYVADVLRPGAAVAKVNGVETNTLADFKKNFVPPNGGKVWTLETDTGKIAALMFNETLAMQLQTATAMNAAYLVTPSIASAAEKLGFKGEEGGLRSLVKKPRKQALLSESRLVGVGGEVRAAGPLVVRRSSPTAGLSTLNLAVGVEL